MTSDRPYERDWTWHHPATAAERLDQACWSLVEESGFRASLVHRSRRRLLEQPPTPSARMEAVWLLPGLDQFSDEYPEYVVSLRQGRYACSCWGHAFGTARAKKFCSHLVAVVLWRRREQAEALDEELALADEAPDLGRAESVAPAAAAAGRGWVTPADLGLEGNPEHPFDRFRGVQLVAIRKIVKEFQDGKRVVFCQAPTGVGKSLLAAAVAKVLDVPLIYTSSTKLLQDQFLSSFPQTAATIKGRANYTPLNALPPEDGCEDPEAHVPPAGEPPTCGDCNREDGRCTLCHDVQLCPYTLAKKRALFSGQAVLNTAYYLAEANSAGRFSDHSEEGLRPRHPGGLRLVVCDEGDGLEDALLSAVTLEVSKSRREELGLEPPPHKDPTDKEGEWGGWIREQVLPAANKRAAALGELATLLKLCCEDARDGGLGRSANVPTPPRARELYAALYELPLQPQMGLYILERLAAKVAGHASGLGTWLGRVEFMAADLQGNDRSWVRTDDPDRTQTITFKPVKVDRFGRECLTRHAGRFLVMSATLLSFRRMCRDLGVDPGEAAWLDLPSPFPADQRPVFYTPVASMVRKSLVESIPAVVAAMNAIVDQRPGERVLVHSVSYDLANRLCEGLADQSRLVTFGGAGGRDFGPGDFGRGGRDAALRHYLDHPGSVLIAPALDRGVDLPDDLCRCIIVPKYPHPSLGDKQVARRLYGFGKDGQEWYTAQAVRTLCQATGRGYRHLGDYVEVFILDESFDRLWREGGYLFPGYWKDALIWETARQRESRDRFKPRPRDKKLQAV